MRRIHQGVYALGQQPLSFEARCLAAVLAVEERGVVTGLAAAKLWGVSRWPNPRVELVLPTRRRSFDDVVVKVSRSLVRADMTRIGRVPIASPARTLVDLGVVLDPRQLAWVLHRMRFRRLIDDGALRDCIERNRTRSATTRLREALDLEAHGGRGTDSSLEDVLHALFATPDVRLQLAAVGADAPIHNAFPDVAGPPIRVDALWPDHRVCVEADPDHHSRPQSQRDDAGRDARLREVGYTVLRFTEADLRRRGDQVVARTIDALRASVAAKLHTSV